MATRSRSQLVQRADLARLTTDPRLQKQLENLFEDVAKTLPESADEAIAKATEALEATQTIKAQSLLSTTASPGLPNARTLAVGTGLTVLDGGSGGDFTIGLHAFLRSLANLSGFGLVVKTAAGAQIRVLEAGSARVEVMYGDATGGNPTIDIDEPSLDIANMGGVLQIEQGGTGVTSLCTFSANNDGATQTIPPALFTALAFPQEAYDEGDAFASNAWTPPAGRPVMLTGAVRLTMGAAGMVSVAVFKNGSVFRIGGDARGTGDVAASVTCTDMPNGTDVYTLRVYQTSGAPQPTHVSGSATYFQGSVI